MIHLQQFNAYLKISWIKRFFSNLKGGWQKIMAKNIKYYGGERISINSDCFKFGSEVSK
jgi:hypothetical protein